jgi:hypothetical protein
MFPPQKLFFLMMPITPDDRRDGLSIVECLLRLLRRAFLAFAGIVQQEFPLGYIASRTGLDTFGRNDE